MASWQWKAQTTALALGAVLVCAIMAAAQVTGTAHLQAPAAVEAKAHATVTTTLRVSVEPGFHIQSNDPKLDYLIPSSITIKPASGITVAKVSWPKPSEHTFNFAPDSALAVFEGTVPVAVTLKTGNAGDTTLHGSFRYQACNDQLCKPPVTVPFTLALHVR